MDSGLRNFVGLYGLGSRNDRGERLIQFAADNNLTIMNTVFKQHSRRLYTWTSPSGEHRNQIDYIMIPTRWRSSITNAHTLPGADCHSDHQLLVCNLRIKLRNTIRKNTNRRMEVTDRKGFSKTLRGTMANWRGDAEDEHPDTLWQNAKNYIKEAIQKSQPKPTPVKHQHWMSMNTWHMVEHRRILKARGTPVRDLNSLNSEIQTACRRDRNAALNNICEELERHSQKFETKDLHMKIRSITRQFKPKTWAIENTAGVTVTEIKEIVNTWKDYCGSLFADSQSAQMSMVCLQPAELEPGLLRDEIRAAINHLKPNKAVGVDEIPIEVIKAMGETGVDILHTICCKIWNNGDWPKDWSNSLFIPLHKKGSTKKCNNYRLISLISHASKVLLHVINKRLQSYLSREKVLSRVEGRENKLSFYVSLLTNLVNSTTLSSYASSTSAKLSTLCSGRNCGKYLQKWVYQII